MPSSSVLIKTNEPGSIGTPHFTSTPVPLMSTTRTRLRQFLPFLSCHEIRSLQMARKRPLFLWLKRPAPPVESFSGAVPRDDFPRSDVNQFIYVCLRFSTLASSK